MVHIRFRIEEILEERGKTKYWLLKRVNQLRFSHGIFETMSYNNFRKICRNEVTSIHMSTLEDFCEALDIHPGELFEVSKDDSKI